MIHKLSLTITLTAVLCMLFVSGCSENHSKRKKIVYVDLTGDGSSGKTWETAFNTIQEAVDVLVSKKDSGQVWVAAGTYTNHFWKVPIIEYDTYDSKIEFYGGFTGYNNGAGLSETSLSQRNWKNNATILDGEGIIDVIDIESTNGLIIDGFTVTGGKSYGADIDWQWRPLIIANCDFINNSQYHDYHVHAALRIDTSEIATITNCRFYNNKCALYVDPGGIYKIFNCVFAGNIEGSISSASAIEFDRATAEMYHCTFVENSGTGVYRDWETDALITNCIFWGTSMSSSSCSYCVIEGETDYYKMIIPNDPLFVDADGLDNVYGTLDDNYHLQPSSPCIDFGSSSLGIKVDYDGKTRPQGSGYDLGAFEY